jgi:hypothetical protein
MKNLVIDLNPYSSGIYLDGINIDPPEIKEFFSEK